MKSLCLSMLLVLSLASVVMADAEWISITGTIVSNSDGVLVLRTSTGNLTFDLDKSTEAPASLPVNSRVTVWYDSDDKPEDKMDARRIVMAPAAPPAPAPASTQVTPPPPVRETVTTVETRETVTTESEPEVLPQTAGPLPLIGGLGLLSVACGALLKRKTGRR